MHFSSLMYRHQWEIVPIDSFSSGSANTTFIMLLTANIAYKRDRIQKFYGGKYGLSVSIILAW